MRGKSDPFPQRDSNLYLWDTRPSCLRLHHESRHTLRQLKQTLQTLTHELHHEIQACITEHSNCCVCMRACVCMRVSARARVCVCVCVCHYEKKIAVVVLVVSLRLLCCSNPSRPCCWKGFALLSSVSASQNFSPHVTLFCCFYVEEWVAAGRRLQICLPSACMSKHEQHFAQSSGVRMAG